MQLSLLTWPQVDTYLKTKSTLIIPIGSVEQHGPTGLIGTDHLTATAIANEVGLQTKTLVAAPINYGMAYHHLAFAGSSALRPTTLVKVVSEIIENFSRHGFCKILLINGHGGNIAPVTTAFCELQTSECNLDLQMENWWKMPEIIEYEQKHFGEENGFHATVGEISVTQHLEPKAFATIPTQSFKIKTTPHAWPLSPKRFRETFPDGRMESNPGLATAQHGKQLFDIAVSALCQKLKKLEEL